MAVAENIGYDAKGRKTFNVFIENETRMTQRVETQSSDLFDYRVTYEWAYGTAKKPGWTERHRQVLPNTGIVARWRTFQKDPTEFLRSKREGGDGCFAITYKELLGRFDPKTYLYPRQTSGRYPYAILKSFSTRRSSAISWKI
jgi:hypothetical protein